VCTFSLHCSLQHKQPGLHWVVHASSA
jgi:hypothetical protein